MSAAQPACEPTDKLAATLTARAALAGFALQRLADGSYLASRWNLTRPLPDLWAVSRFLDQVGAR